MQQHTNSMHDPTRNFPRSEPSDRHLKKSVISLSKINFAPNSPIINTSSTKVLSKYKSNAPVHFVSPHPSSQKVALSYASCNEAKVLRVTSPKSMQKLGEKISEAVIKRNEVKSPSLCQMKTLGGSLNSDIPKLEKPKISVKKSGMIKAYAANTNQGIIRYFAVIEIFLVLLISINRNYNEDRVAIILNIIRPSNKKPGNWPKSSLFGIYDGHGGALCADYLRDNLHHQIVRDPYFPNDPIIASAHGFANSEKQFFELCESKNDKSGSCAIVALFVENELFIANLGDSRAIISEESGKITLPLSTDHKPNNQGEYERIILNGGSVYQYFS